MIFPKWATLNFKLDVTYLVEAHQLHEKLSLTTFYWIWLIWLKKISPYVRDFDRFSPFNLIDWTNEEFKMTVIQVKYKIKIVEKSNDGGKNWSPLRYFRKSISEIRRKPINTTGRHCRTSYRTKPENRDSLEIQESRRVYFIDKYVSFIPVHRYSISHQISTVH